MNPDTPPGGAGAPPGAVPGVERWRSHLLLADAAPRCGHVRDDGRRCGSPALRGATLCHHHDRAAAEERKAAVLAAIDDPASLQLALQQVLSDLFAGRLRARTAGQMLYGLQIAALSLRRFGPPLNPAPTGTFGQETSSRYGGGKRGEPRIGAQRGGEVLYHRATSRAGKGRLQSGISL